MTASAWSLVQEQTLWGLTWKSKLALFQKGWGSPALGPPLPGMPGMPWRLAFGESGRGLLERGQPHGIYDPEGGSWGGFRTGCR